MQRSIFSYLFDKRITSNSTVVDNINDFNKGLCLACHGKHIELTLLMNEYGTCNIDQALFTALCLKN